MNIGSIGYSISFIAFLLLFIVLLSDRHHGISKKLLVVATLSSCLWSLAMAYQAATGKDYITPQVLEFVKNIAWIALLMNMLGSVYGESSTRKLIKLLFIIIVLFVSAMTIPVMYQYLSRDLFAFGGNYKYILGTHLLLSVIGIVLVEQLYRNTRVEQRWVIKYLCISLGSLYVFDFHMYTDGLLYKRIDLTLWHARGFIDALVVPLIGISVMRDPLWSPEIFISRKVIFHTTTLVASGTYLMTMGFAGYYIRDYGGDWGLVAQAFFLFFASLVLLLFLFSKRIRARWKVLLNKHLYPYKYDYRDEWLRFVKTISSVDNNSDLYINIINSLAQIIDSPGGMLWLKNKHGFFECVKSVNYPCINIKEPSKSSLPIFLNENEFVININEFNNNPEVYNRLGYLELPKWINELNPWLIVPLIHIDSLIGFIILDHSTAQIKHFNWEDSDLLKTAARQAASFIEQHEVSKELAEAKQFESFNKLSTYIVHDIKNLITQLSLITSNAEKHRGNQLFIDDVIDTVSYSVDKMNKMMDLLRGRNEDKLSSKVNIIELLSELVKSRQISGGKPIPTLECESQKCFVKADYDQLLSIFGHIVQNAQDATDENGKIKLVQSIVDENVLVEIVDTGSGMDEEFIQKKLFMPFKTTKGDKGMGIGAYEAREIITALGGYLEVVSTPGEGSTFKVYLPYLSP